MSFNGFGTAVGHLEKQGHHRTGFSILKANKNFAIVNNVLKQCDFLRFFDQCIFGCCLVKNFGIAKSCQVVKQVIASFGMWLCKINSRCRKCSLLRRC